MRKKIIAVIFIIGTFMLALVGCGDSKYKVTQGSKLTDQDMTLLKSKFDNYTKEGLQELSEIKDKMTSDEFIKFKDDLKRLYMEENKKIYSTKESAEKIFEENYNYFLKKKQGKLTEKDKKNYEYLDKKEKDFNNKVRKYSEIKEEIEDRLDSNVKYKYQGYVVKTDVEKESNIDKISIDVDVETLKKITKDQIQKIRNDVVDEVQKVVKHDIIKLNLELNDQNEREYIFDKGKWNKDVEL